MNRLINKAPPFVRDAIWLTLLLVVIGLVLTALASIGSDSEQSYTVSLTGSVVGRKCTSNSRGECTYPNKGDVVGTFNIPSYLLDSDHVPRRYDHDVAFRLTVDSEGIYKIDRKRDNYLRSMGWVTIRSLSPSISLEDQMRRSWYFRNEISDYQIVETDIEGSVKYDNLSCSNLGLDHLDGTAIDRLDLKPYWKKRCFHFRKQFYFWPDYHFAYARCPRVQNRQGFEVALPCRITTLVTPKVIAFYTVPSENVRDSSWMDYDKKIREFLLQFHLGEA